MARPRAGVRLVDGRWTAALPVALGASKRTVFTSPDRDPVQRWYEAGLVALSEGRALPDKAQYRQSVTPPVLHARSAPAHHRPRTARWWAGATAASGHRLDLVAESMIHQRFEQQRKGGVDRQIQVEAAWRTKLWPWLQQQGLLTVEQVENSHMIDLVAHLAGQRPIDRQVTDAADAIATSKDGVSIAGLDGHVQVTKAQARALAGLSRSRLHRWRSQGLLPGWQVDPVDERVRIPVDELRAAWSQSLDLAVRTGLAKESAGNVLWVMRQVLNYAQANCVPLTGVPMYGIEAIEPDLAVAIHPATGEREHLTLAQMRPIAAGLHPVHQTAFWLMRILGLRIGEAYVLQVQDFTDFGAGNAGALDFHRQGGRTFRRRSDEGTTTSGPSSEKLKNKPSNRLIKIPEQLAALLRVVIEVFHTDPASGMVTRPRGSSRDCGDTTRQGRPDSGLR